MHFEAEYEEEELEAGVITQLSEEVEESSPCFESSSAEEGASDPSSQSP